LANMVPMTICISRGNHMKDKVHLYDILNMWDAGTKTWVLAACGTPVCVGYGNHKRKPEDITCKKCLKLLNKKYRTRKIEKRCSVCGDNKGVVTEWGRKLCLPCVNGLIYSP
jgi:hypothetical protein